MDVPGTDDEDESFTTCRVLWKRSTLPDNYTAENFLQRLVRLLHVSLRIILLSYPCSLSHESVQARAFQRRVAYPERSRISAAGARNTASKAC